LDGAPGLGAIVKLAPGIRCARSWKFTTDVGTDPRYPDLSARDAAVVAMWDKTNGR
jgi:isoleucyl-tRNA synthetase